MKRDLPQHLAHRPSTEGEPPRSVLASRAFWLGGLLSVLVWALVIYLVYYLAR